MKLLFTDIKIGSYRFAIISVLWFGAAILAVLLELGRGTHSVNNFLIYKGVFEHTVRQTNLFLEYPLEYADRNHYGPLFSMLIAPFALLPTAPACVLWALANAAVLFYAIRKLGLSPANTNILLAIGLIEMMTSIHSVQFNPMLTGAMLLAYVWVKEGKIAWAALLIVAGTMIKLYPIIGCSLFLFTRKKKAFVGWLACWSVILFFLPALISSVSFVFQSYTDWFEALVRKNGTNTDISLGSGMQDISVGGMIRRIFGYQELSNLQVLLPVMLLLLLPLLRLAQFAATRFQLQYYLLLMVGTVIFSSSAESPTYVIAVVAIATWIAYQPQITLAMKGLLVFLFLFTILSPTDLYPPYIRSGFFVQYSLKALPCFVAWCAMLLQLLTQNFLTIPFVAEYARKDRHSYSTV